MESKCSAFWHHTNIRSDNRIFPCCRFKTSVATFTGNVSEVLFYKEYDKLRESSLAGEHITGCEKCYYEESLGKESLRQKFNKEYECEDVKLEYLEIGFDNICNLTCDGCWDEFSSAWAKEKYPKEKTMWIKSSTDITDIPDTINKVLFLGGEPLMTTRHYKFLKLIKDPSKVEITYNTNGTFLLDQQTIEKLKEFNRVVFILSIDGYGELNDRVRNGSNWSDILKFIEQIKSLGFILEVNTVIHINNWQGMPELSAFINSLGINWTTNALTYPSELSVKNVSNKKDFVELISGIDIPNKEYLIKHLS
jgi:sulfatase maturation enzyme AslB (radical SAM superfamily)